MPKHNLTPTLYVSPTVAYAITPTTVLVELPNVPTSGPINVYINRDSRVKLSFNPETELVGGRAVTNRVWSFSTTSSYYILTTSQVIEGG